MQEENILVPKEYSEEKFVNYLKKIYNLDKFDLEIIYLIFNTNCNLACKYCYIEKSKEINFSHNSMSKKTFEEVMNYLGDLVMYQRKINQNKKKLTFIYYGSEPLMSKKYFVKSLKVIEDICKKNSIVPDFQITTNGTLLDKEIAENLKKYKVKISISLDGKKEINDIMRVDINGNGTYNRVIDGINLLKQFRIPFGISCTINRHNVKCFNECANHLISLGATSIGFNILLSARNDKIPMISLEDLNDKLLDASENLNKLGYYEDRIQRKVEAFNKLPRFKDCGGVGNQLVFFPNGDLGTCEAYLCSKSSKIGNIESLKVEDIQENPIIKYWTERYPLNMKECLYCPCLGICGGGCPFNAETLSQKNIYERDKPFCVHTDKALNWLLKKSIQNATGKKNPYVRDVTFSYSNNFF